MLLTVALFSIIYSANMIHLSCFESDKISLAFTKSPLSAEFIRWSFICSKGEVYDSYAKEIKDVILDMSFNQIFEASALRDARLSHIPDTAYYKMLEKVAEVYSNTMNIIHMI